MAVFLSLRSLWRWFADSTSVRNNIIHHAKVETSCRALFNRRLRRRALLPVSPRRTALCLPPRPGVMMMMMMLIVVLIGLLMLPALPRALIGLFHKTLDCVKRPVLVLPQPRRLVQHMVDVVVVVVVECRHVVEEWRSQNCAVEPAVCPLVRAQRRRWCRRGCRRCARRRSSGRRGAVFPSSCRLAEASCRASRAKSYRKPGSKTLTGRSGWPSFRSAWREGCMLGYRVHRQSSQRRQNRRSPAAAAHLPVSICSLCAASASPSCLPGRVHLERCLRRGRA